MFAVLFILFTSPVDTCSAEVHSCDWNNSVKQAHISHAQEFVDCGKSNLSWLEARLVCATEPGSSNLPLLYSQQDVQLAVRAIWKNHVVYGERDFKYFLPIMKPRMRKTWIWVAGRQAGEEVEHWGNVPFALPPAAALADDYCVYSDETGAWRHQRCDHVGNAPFHVLCGREFIPRKCADQPCQGTDSICVDTLAPGSGNLHGSNTSYKCICAHGLEGKRCQYRSSSCDMLPGDCIHGTCVRDQESGSVQCLCEKGWGGPSCSARVETACAAAPCAAGATCVDVGATFTCECPRGFSGSDCSKFDACASSPCVNSGTCINSESSYFCQCPGGVSGKNCHSFVKQPTEINVPSSEEAAATDGNVAVQNPFSDQPTAASKETRADSEKIYFIASLTVMSVFGLGLFLIVMLFVLVKIYRRCSSNSYEKIHKLPPRNPSPNSSGSQTTDNESYTPLNADLTLPRQTDPARQLPPPEFACQLRLEAPDRLPPEATHQCPPDASGDFESSYLEPNNTNRLDLSGSNTSLAAGSSWVEASSRRNTTTDQNAARGDFPQDLEAGDCIFGLWTSSEANNAAFPTEDWRDSDELPLPHLAEPNYFPMSRQRPRNT